MIYLRKYVFSIYLVLFICLRLVWFWALNLTKKCNHISVSDTSMCLWNWGPFWNGGYGNQFTTTAYKYHPKFTGLKPPQSAISHNSVSWLGARQWSSAGLSWAILCSQLEGLGKLAWPLTMTLNPGLLASEFWWSKKLMRPFEGKPWKSYIITFTTFFFAQSKAGTSSESRRNETDTTSWWEKQQMVCDFIDPSNEFYINEPYLLEAWSSSLHPGQPGLSPQ